ncbi:uncharacterized protein LOC110269194 [Arachis ipaensis]|uniref:uncharacterized protein LOC110269194 n=1 Tax=Arachis ipaensis TaxID=130454 RepID=UPI000A2B0DB3|nr:uncharacterized protein LOC110269194 [Arachis ipaensis]
MDELMKSLCRHPSRPWCRHPSRPWCRHPQLHRLHLLKSQHQHAVASHRRSSTVNTGSLHRPQHFELLCRHIGVKWSHNFTGHLKDEERDLIRVGMKVKIIPPKQICNKFL